MPKGIQEIFDKKSMMFYALEKDAKGALQVKFSLEVTEERLFETAAAKRDKRDLTEVAVVSERAQPEEASEFDALISGAAAPVDLLVPETPILLPDPEEGHATLGTDEPQSEGATADTHLRFELPRPTDT